MNLKGKTALVTGGSSGLGLSFVEMLLREGVEVWATSRDVSRVPVKENLHALAVDLTLPEEVAKFTKGFIKRHGCPDILINNAGYGAYYEWDSFPEEQITGQIEILLKTPISLCRAFAPVMKKRGSGSIVNVSSMACQYPLPFMHLYNAAKAGLAAFTDSLMIEYSDSKVAIIDFRPGDFRTPFNKGMAMTEIKQNSKNESAYERAWLQLEKYLNAAPEVAIASAKMKHCLRRNRSGIFEAGDFFQSVIGPLFFRLAPSGLIRLFIKLYYNLD